MQRLAIEGPNMELSLVLLLLLSSSSKLCRVSPIAQPAFVTKYVNPACLPHAGSFASSHLRKQCRVVELVVWLTCWKTPQKKGIASIPPHDSVWQTPPGLLCISPPAGVVVGLLDLIDAELQTSLLAPLGSETCHHWFTSEKVSHLRLCGGERTQRWMWNQRGGE